MGHELSNIDLPTGDWAKGVVLLDPTTGGLATPANFRGDLYTGQLLVTTTPQQLPAHALSNGLVITAAETNRGKIVFGPTGLTDPTDGTGNGDILTPGLPRSPAVDNANKVWVRLGKGNTSTTDFISYSGN